jgi:NAD(P)-dependent dehydrogenase (short-subunit alcohol dehydrogenase family)
MQPTVLDTFRLTDKTALVTGSGRGLGRAMAIALAQAGARLVLWDINQEDLEETLVSIGVQDSSVLTAVVDVTREDAVREGVRAASDHFGPIGILVNNAGVTTGSPFEDLAQEDWEHVLSVNLGGIFQCSKWVAQGMIASGEGGSIINMASISGLVGNRGGNNSHYCATKGGVIALTRSLAVEWAPHRIRVNAIAPGYFVTPMTDRLKKRNAGFYQELIERIPLGRFGEPPDLAGAVVYLASPASAFITGNVLVVDGGYTAW